MLPGDLIVLAADADAKATVEGLLTRPNALGTRTIEFRCFRPAGGGDPRCRGNAHDLLRPFLGKYDHALVVFDRHGCGADRETRKVIEETVETRLTANGWRERNAAIVIDPELESWVWTPSPRVDAALGWEGSLTRLRDWLVSQAMLVDGAAKPGDPKAAMRAALRHVKRSTSPALFGQIARETTLDGCVDPSFLKFRGILQRWFPATKG